MDNHFIGRGTRGVPSWAWDRDPERRQGRIQDSELERAEQRSEQEVFDADVQATISSMRMFASAEHVLERCTAAAVAVPSYRTRKVAQAARAEYNRCR